MPEVTGADGLRGGGASRSHHGASRLLGTDLWGLLAAFAAVLLASAAAALLLLALPAAREEARRCEAEDGGFCGIGIWLVQVWGLWSLSLSIGFGLTALLSFPRTGPLRKGAALITLVCATPLAAWVLLAGAWMTLDLIGATGRSFTLDWPILALLGVLGAYLIWRRFRRRVSK